MGLTRCVAEHATSKDLLCGVLCTYFLTNLEDCRPQAIAQNQADATGGNHYTILQTIKHIYTERQRCQTFSSSYFIRSLTNIGGGLLREAAQIICDIKLALLEVNLKKKLKSFKTYTSDVNDSEQF